MIPELFSCDNLMTPELLDFFACGVLWVAGEWIVSLVFAFCNNCSARNETDFDINMQLLAFRGKRLKQKVKRRGNGSRCARTQSEKSRQKIREGGRHRIYAKAIILPVLTRQPSKEIELLRNLSEDMSQVPLIAAEESSNTESPDCNMVLLEAGLPGDTWSYCVKREQLAERSEWFRAMLVGPLAPAPSNPPPLLKLQHVEKRAFDYLFRYLLDEPINFQSVSTARATLDAAHQYLCTELARLAIEYLERNLNSNTVLEIYQGLSLYATHVSPGLPRSFNEPTAPPAPGDDAGEIAVVCTRLLLACLDVIDSEPEAVFSQEHFEELTAIEVNDLACRDTLKLINESVLFYALDRWAASECRRHGVEPLAANKRSALSDEVWYSVRYPLMSDREFIEGPMASGILSSEESAIIVARILGHTETRDDEEHSNTIASPLCRLSSKPRIVGRICEDPGCTISKPGKKERQDNRKNRRKECASQGHRTCARIGNCLVRVLACVFD